MTITLTNPLDLHIHLREGSMLKAVLPYSAKYFACVLAMPNLKVPIDSTSLALKYQKEILASNPKDFTPLMSLYITPNLSVNELQKAHENGIKIIKLYPKGATTNSENGISNILDSKTCEIFQKAQELGMILSIHGETDGYCLDREFEFLAIFAQIATTFPKLKVIIEHMSDRRSLEMIEKYENLYATLTLHHITMSLDDVLGSSLNAHHFCKPMLKSPKDRDALLHAALNAHPKISFGSDSAPHPLVSKLQNGAAGIFSAPILLPSLCELFDKYDKLDNLQAFISDNGMKNYDLKFDFTKKVTLEKGEFIAPSSVKYDDGEIIPLRANQKIGYKIS